jgi:hypothetical protein
MSEAKPVPIRAPDSATIQGTFLLWDESPDDPDGVRLELSFEGRAITADSDVGYFDAMSKIRQVIEPDGYRLLCLGASKGVYPSGMSRSMGAGDKAYKLEMGRAATMKDIVSIFDTDASVVPVTLGEQQAYFDEWMGSLR